MADSTWDLLSTIQYPMGCPLGYPIVKMGLFFFNACILQYSLSKPLTSLSCSLNGNKTLLKSNILNSRQPVLGLSKLFLVRFHFTFRQTFPPLWTRCRQTCRFSSPTTTRFPSPPTWPWPARQKREYLRTTTKTAWLDWGKDSVCSVCFFAIVN
jgi:hypothetical protein